MTTESPLWDWATVARWMYAHKKLPREAALQAEIVRQANEAIARGEGRIGERLRKTAKEYAKELDEA